MIVDEVREHSADPASFTAELLRLVNDPSPDQSVELLLADADSPVRFVDTMTTVLAAARIPARMIRGVQLQDQTRRADLIPWLEVHDGDRWRYFDPRSGEETLPERFLIWCRGNDPLARVDGGSNIVVNFAVQQSLLDSMSIAEQRAEARQSTLVEFSLFGLPIQTQAVYSVLLMIPIGALIMVIMRNIVGIDAFGTFMPVLIALSFRETRLLWGAVLFTLLVTLGLTIRFLLERLRLLLVPRLTAVLIVVVLLMLVISVVSHKLGTGNRSVGRVIPNGDHRDDDRAHVRCVGGARCRRRNPWRYGKPRRGHRCLSGDGHGLVGASGLHVSRASPPRACGRPAHRALHRVSSDRAGPL